MGIELPEKVCERLAGEGCAGAGPGVGQPGDGPAAANAQTPTAVAMGARSENGEVEKRRVGESLAATEFREGRFWLRSGMPATG